MISYATAPTHRGVSQFVTYDYTKYIVQIDTGSCYLCCGLGIEQKHVINRVVVMLNFIDVFAMAHTKQCT